MTQEEFLKQANEKINQTLSNLKEADTLVSGFNKSYSKEKLNALEPEENQKSAKKTKK